jgi:4-amino-4-deoxy-L-arabinose transferase-like glycosyltransferase
LNITTVPAPRGRRASLILLAAIILLGLDLRLTATTSTQVGIPLRADAADYFMYAYNLRFHGVYSRDKGGYNAPEARPPADAARYPGYPLFLTLFVDRTLGPLTLLNITLAQALLGTLLIVLAYRLGRAFLPDWAALGVALLTAISPHLINASVYVLTETWFAFLLTASLLAMIVAMGSQARRWPWLAAGLLLGAAALTRPGIQYFPLFLVPLLWLSLDGSRRLAAVLLLLVGVAVVLGPWLMRNEMVLDESSDPGLKNAFLHHGMYPDFMYGNDLRTYGFPYRFDPRSSEISRSVGSALTEIKRRFEDEPARYLSWYLLGKPAMLWSWNIVQGAGDAFVYPVTETPYVGNRLFQVTHAAMGWTRRPLVVLAALGTLLAWIPALSRRRSATGRFGLQLCSLLLLYYTAIHMIGAPFPRYSIPVLPLLYAMALFAIIQIFRMGRPAAAETDRPA